MVINTTLNQPDSQTKSNDMTELLISSDLSMRENPISSNGKNTVMKPIAPGSVDVTPGKDGESHNSVLTNKIKERQDISNAIGYNVPRATAPQQMHEAIVNTKRNHVC